MLFSKKPLVIASLIFCLLSVGIQTTQALTFIEVVNLLQSPDINLPTGVTNPKGNIGFILSNLFWGTADGTKNGKIKPEYLDYSGISAWTQSGSQTYLTTSTGTVGIGTQDPGGYRTAIIGIDNTSSNGGLWVSGSGSTTPGLMVRNDGNVGIGTASPAWPLHVSASIADWAVGIINSNASGYGVYIKGGKADGTTQSLHIRNVDNIPLFNVLGNGNVGIGTALPRGNLDVTFPSGSNAVPFIVDNGTYGIYMAGQNTLNFNYSQNADGGGWINYYGYAGASTQFRSLFIGNGKGSPIAYFQGSTGNVGIGTTSPGRTLDVSGGVNGVIMRLSGYTNARRWDINMDSAGLGIMYNSAAEALKITESGNVGIGITTPGAKLHIFANPQTTFPMYIGTTDDNNGATKNPYAWNYIPGLLISNDWDGDVATVNSTKIAKIVLNTAAGSYNNGGSIHAEGAGGYNQGQLIFSTGWDSNSLATERMRIGATGNVGIGTASPGAMLEVTRPAGAPTVSALIARGTATTKWGAEIIHADGPYANIAGGTYAGVFMNGNVGIGIATPGTKLDIRGSGDTLMDLVDSSDASRGLLFRSGTATSLASEITTNSVNRELALGVDDVEYIRIKNNGKIGIGTASPTSKLHLINAGTSDPSLTHGAAAMVAMAPGSGTELVIGGMAASPYTAWIQHRHQTGDGSSFNLALQPSGGNVGIGTIAPATKLHVVGNIRNSAPSVGYVELSGDLPGYAVNTYPTLKTSGSTLYFSAGGAYSSYISTNGAYTAVSDRNRKENFKILNPQEILDKINRLPMTEWNYKGENSNVRHIGPIAQDFHALFGLNGPNDKMISHIDPSGVALAGIKGLSEQNKVQDAKIKKLEKENNILKSLICLDHKNAEICK